MRKDLPDIDDLKRQYSVSSLLGISGDKRLIVCPLPDHNHHSNTPSFSIYYGEDGFERFICHGNCGARGDVVDLMGYLKIPGYDPTRDEDVIATFPLFHDREPEIIVPQPPSYSKETTLPPALWKKFLPPGEDVIAYAASRGLSRETLERFGVGQSGMAMVIPTFQEGILVNIKYRNLGDGLRYWNEKGSVKSLFNYDAIAWTTEPILITKGHIPTMLMSQHGISSCCCTAGENASMDLWYPQLSLASKRVYVGDNDRDLKVRKVMQDAAQKRGAELSADVKFPPEQYKDLDEWVLADVNALDIIRGWLA